MNYVTESELESALSHLHDAPANHGRVELIACRPRTGERAVLQEAKLDLTEGLIGDNWKARGSSKTADGSAHPDLQLTVMNSRVTALVAREKNHWPLAGDQLWSDRGWQSVQPSSKLLPIRILAAKNLASASGWTLLSLSIQTMAKPCGSADLMRASFSQVLSTSETSWRNSSPRIRGILTRISPSMAAEN